jgi:DNA-binding transcriptional regulator YhcF (GntR family)
VIITIDGSSSVPPYEQLREQIVTMAVSGVLSEGDRLPTIRQLAADLDLAPGTVGRAFRELEHVGVIVTKGRHGTFVAGPPALSRRDRDRRLADEAARFARTADQLGVTPHDALVAVRQALQA